MSDWAYEDRAKISAVKAADLHGLSLDRDYYCPGNGCGAVMYLRQGNGSLNRAASFVAYPSKPHMDTCLFRSENAGKALDSRLVDEDSFNFEAAVEALMSADVFNVKRLNGAGASHELGNVSGDSVFRLKHISQLYLMLKNMHVDDVFAGMHVGEMLCDGRSEQSYHVNPIEGAYICECYKNAMKPFYDKEELAVRLRVRRYNGRIVHIKFSNESHFWDMVKFILGNAKRSVVVAGKWRRLEKGSNEITCEIASDRQYFLSNYNI